MVAYPRSFAGQFVIGASEALPERADGVVHRLNDLAVVTVGELPVARVRDADGRLIGAFLGYPLDYRRGSMLGEAVSLEETTRDPRAWTRSSRTASTAMPGPTYSSWTTRSSDGSIWMRVARCLRSSIRSGCSAPRPPACSCLQTSTPAGSTRISTTTCASVTTAGSWRGSPHITASAGCSGTTTWICRTACSVATGPSPRCAPQRTRTRRARPSTPSSHAR